jgi:protein-disulfide isomerase
VAGAPAADPGGLAGALKPGSPPVGDYLGRPGSDPADRDLPHGRHPPAGLLQPGALDHQRDGRTGRNHELLFGRQKALQDDDLRRYAAQLGLDVAVFDRDRAGAAVADRIRRDVGSGLASGQVLGMPTLFIDGIVHRGGYDPPALLAALSRWR